MSVSINVLKPPKQLAKKSGRIKAARQARSQPSVTSQAAINAKTRARLEFLEEDPLEFWDLGMIFAFDVIARKLQNLSGDHKVLTETDILSLLAEERKKVLDRELYTFLSSSDATPSMPRLAWAVRMAVARSAGKQRRRSSRKRSSDTHGAAGGA